MDIVTDATKPYVRVLIMLIPFIVVWIAAFQKWPVENEASVQPD